METDVEKYFTADEFVNMMEYERMRYANIIHNYEALRRLGNGFC